MLALLLAVLLVAGLHYDAEMIRGTPALVVAAGVACAILFVIVLTCCGACHALVSSGVSSGVIEVAVSFVVMLAVAASIHPICMTVGSAGSLILLWYVTRVINDIYFASTDARPPGKNKGA